MGSIVRAILKRDVRRWFSNPTGYVFITLFVFLSAFALFVPPDFFQNNIASLDTLNQWFRLLLLMFIPAVTMSIWAGERSQGTDELMLTLPATDGQVVLGKYLAAAGIYSVTLLFTLPQVIVLWLLGTPDFGLIFSNYLGFWFLGLVLIGAGMVGSQLSDNLTVAFILGALLCGVVVFLEDILSLVAPDLMRTWIGYGPVAMFHELARGIISLAALLLFGGLIAGFLFLNTLLLSRRHWRGAEGLHLTVRFVSILFAVLSLTILGSYAASADLTVEQIHSLTEDTEKILSELDPERPVFVEAFISPEVPRTYVPVRRNLLNLLRRYDSEGGDGLIVRIVETERYSEEARQAKENYDIEAQTVFSDEGGRVQPHDIYLGLAFKCGIEESVIPFMFENLPIEYELTRSLRVVSQSERRTVGVLTTDVDIIGAFDFMSGPLRAWDIIPELKLQYKVVRVDPAAEYEEEFDVLLVPMASSLTQEQMDRLAAHIRGGGPTLILDDPMPAAAPGNAPTDPKPNPNRNPMMQGMQPPGEEKGDIRAFLRELDIEWPYTDIVWDTYNPAPQLSMVEREIVFVSAKSDAAPAFNPDEPTSSGLQTVIAIFGGHVREGTQQNLTFTPLLRSSKLSGTVDYNEMFRFDPLRGRGLDPNRKLRRDGGEKIMACRVTGRMEGEDAASIHVIFIPDLDMVSPAFFQIRRQGLGDIEIDPDNIPFILNCVDQLAGDESFIALRKRRPKLRTLETVEKEQKVFEEEWLSAKQRAEDKAKEELDLANQRLKDRVQEIEESTDLDEQSKEIRKDSVREAEQRRFDLRSQKIEDEKQAAIDLAQERKKDQERSIERWYTGLGLVISPLAAIAVGIIVLVRRVRREREIIPGGRSTGGAA